MRKFVTILAILLIAGTLQAEKLARIWWWYGTTPSGQDVVLCRQDSVAASDGAITGLYDADEDSYYFRIDIENADEYDPSKLYKIYEGEDVTLDSMMIGCAGTNDSLRIHLADTTAHDAAGGVVGATKEQELTNKTIDGDVNTLRDISPRALKDSLAHNDFQVRPSASNDVYFIIRDGDANGLTIQVSDSAGSTDKVLTMKADSVDFQDDGGADIILSGITSGTGSNTAVPKSVTDALDTRLDFLEIGGTWDGAPTVTVDLTRGRVRYVGDLGYAVLAGISLDLANQDSLSRYEIYWDNRSFGNISAGSTSEATLDLLRDRGSKAIIRGGECLHGRTTYTIRTNETIWVVVVAFDASNVDYNSTQERFGDVEGGDIIPQRDADGEIIELRRTIMSPIIIANSASDSTAADFTDFLQSNTTEKIKTRGSYVYNSDDARLYAYFYTKASAGTGYVKFAVMNATSVVKSVTYTTTVTSYPSAPQTIEIDLSSGLTNGMLYEFEVSIWNSASNNTNLRSDVTVEVVSHVPIY